MLSISDAVGTAKCDDLTHIFAFRIWQYRSRLKEIYFIFLHATCALSAANEHEHMAISFIDFS